MAAVLQFDAMYVLEPGFCNNRIDPTQPLWYGWYPGRFYRRCHRRLGGLPPIISWYRCRLHLELWAKLAWDLGFSLNSPIASHGIRTIDNLRTHLGIQDPEILEVRPLRFPHRQVIGWMIFLFLERGRTLRNSHRLYRISRRSSGYCTFTRCKAHYWWGKLWTKPKNLSLTTQITAYTVPLSPKAILGNLHIRYSDLCQVRSFQRRRANAGRLCHLRGRYEGQARPRSVSPWSTEVWYQAGKLSVWCFPWSFQAS